MDAIREENELQEHLDALKIGESFYCKKKEITFIKLSEQETSEKIDQILQRNCTEEPSSHEKQKETLLKKIEEKIEGFNESFCVLLYGPKGSILKYIFLNI